MSCMLSIATRGCRVDPTPEILFLQSSPKYLTDKRFDVDLPPPLSILLALFILYYWFKNIFLLIRLSIRFRLCRGGHQKRQFKRTFAASRYSYSFCSDLLKQNDSKKQKNQRKNSVINLFYEMVNVSNIFIS